MTIPKSAIFADLHIHSNYCGNLSKKGDVLKLAGLAGKKGLGLLGTGDLTNRRWREILYSETCESDGLQWAEGRSGPARGSPPTADEFPFVLSMEVCCSDKSHHVVLIPDRDCAKTLFSKLAKVGKIEKMGRPFLHFGSRALLETCLGTDKKIEVIPAHVWTPHFGMFGEGVHYGSLEEAFGDLAGRIHAVETGLSSDPEMNRRMAFLNARTIVSFSDAHSHSLARLGREATAMKKVKSYSGVISQIRKNSILGTVEVFPAFGKYHLDGHRNCGVSLAPADSLKTGNLCPECSKRLTLGVEHRIEELQSRAAGRTKKPYVTTLPIPEIVSAALGVGAGTAKAERIQEKFISAFGSELSALLFAPEEELARVDPAVGRAIAACRRGKVAIDAGYDSVYGKVKFVS